MRAAQHDLVRNACNIIILYRTYIIPVIQLFATNPGFWLLAIGLERRNLHGKPYTWKKLSTTIQTEGNMTLWHDLKFAARSLARTKGLTVTVILTLALGIGANAAIFTLVRGVLLRPLVNRDEDRLIYIRQSARGIGIDNATFSVPEIQDLRARVKTLSAFGDFSTIGFTMIGLGEPREVRAGVVGGSYSRGDGAASGAGPAARHARRRPEPPPAPWC